VSPGVHEDTRAGSQTLGLVIPGVREGGPWVYLELSDGRLKRLQCLPKVPRHLKKKGNRRWGLPFSPKRFCSNSMYCTPLQPLTFPGGHPYRTAVNVASGWVWGKHTYLCQPFGAKDNEGHHANDQRLRCAHAEEGGRGGQGPPGGPRACAPGHPCCRAQGQGRG